MAANETPGSRSGSAPCRRHFFAQHASAERTIDSPCSPLDAASAREERRASGPPKSASGGTMDVRGTDGGQGSGAGGQALTSGSVCSIPDYDLIRCIGRGAFGEVWLSRNRHDGQFCAIKVFSKAKPAELGGIREYRKRAAGNPFLAPIHHVGESGEFYYYVMPLADDAKQSSTQWLPEDYEPLTLWRYLLWHGRLPIEEVLSIVSCLLNGLERLHGAGGVHCDVKPENVMRFEGVWKLGDPGLLSSTEKLSTTRGTFRFWPPEGTVDQTADLYALGKTMYLLLAGAHVELPERIEDAPLPPGVDQKAPIWRIVERACAPDPARRYRCAAEMKRDVEKLRHDSGTGWRGRFRAWLPAMPVAVLLTLVALGWAWLHRVAPTERADRSPVNAVGVAAEADPGGTDQAAVTAESSRAVRSVPLEGSVTVRTWNRDDPQRRGLAIDVPGVLPLRDGDQIRVEVTLNRPAYVYLVWISTDGTALPIHPWAPGDWSRLPDQERPLRRLALPAGQDQGWPVTGPPGMETLVLLARAKPAPYLSGLRDLFQGLPSQTLGDERPMLVRLERDVFAGSTERGLDFAAGQLDDPVLRAQRLLAERFAKEFELVRVVSFANRAGSAQQEP